MAKGLHGMRILITWHGVHVANMELLDLAVARQHGKPDHRHEKQNTPPLRSVSPGCSPCEGRGHMLRREGSPKFCEQMDSSACVVAALSGLGLKAKETYGKESAELHYRRNVYTSLVADRAMSVHRFG
jgi:hypothetical protein